MNQQPAAGKPAAGKRRRRTFEEHLFSLLSTRWCGIDDVPLSRETFRRGERIASFVNDSFDIGVGTQSEWIYIFKRDEFKAMAIWYLKCWAFKEWFGLRRSIWYWLLHRRIERDRGVRQ